jgi:hypothetical protein
MGQIIRAISDLAGKVISLSLVGGAILLVAGEIRLAALKKASQGSSKLSPFTERMTGMKVNDILK